MNQDDFPGDFNFNVSAPGPLFFEEHTTLWPSINQECCPVAVEDSGTISNCDEIDRVNPTMLPNSDQEACQEVSAQEDFHGYSLPPKEIIEIVESVQPKIQWPSHVTIIQPLDRESLQEACAQRDETDVLPSWFEVSPGIILEEENCQDFKSFGRDVTTALTKEIKDHTSLSKAITGPPVLKIVEDIQTKVTSQSKGPNFSKMRADAQYEPPLRDIEQVGNFIFCTLQSGLAELLHGAHGEHTRVIQALLSSVKDGFSFLDKLGQTRVWISEKVKALMKGLKSRDRIVEQQLQTCASSLSALVPSIFEQNRKKFISISSLKSLMYSAHYR